MSPTQQPLGDVGVSKVESKLGEPQVQGGAAGEGVWCPGWGNPSPQVPPTTLAWARAVILSNCLSFLFVQGRGLSSMSQEVLWGPGPP